MYFVNLPFPKANIIVPDNMYRVMPIANTRLDIDVLHELRNEQEDVITKLTQLLVKLHNATVGSNLKVTHDTVTKVNLSEEHDKIIRRLISIEEKVDQVASERGIDVKNISALELLEAEQHRICLLAEDLDSRVTSCANDHNVQLTEKVGPVINLCLHSDPRNAPLSVFLLLSWLRANGRRVAVVSTVHNKCTEKLSKEISDFLSSKLPLSDNRRSYELILTVVWKQNGLTDCTLVDDVYNDTPFFGEKMAVLAICHALGLPLDMETVESLQTVAEDTKMALSTLNKAVCAPSVATVALAGAVVSPLLRSEAPVKCAGKKRAAAEAFLSASGLNLALP